MYTLTVRKLDDATALKLKEMAAKKGISMEALARKILTDFTISAEVAYVEDKYASLTKDMLSLYKSSIDEVNVVLQDNIYMLEKLARMMEGEEDE